jgi:hypothetical protein
VDEDFLNEPFMIDSSLGIPSSTSIDVVPGLWKELRAIWVVSLLIDWDTIIPTASPGSTRSLEGLMINFSYLQESGSGSLVQETFSHASSNEIDTHTQTRKVVSPWRGNYFMWKNSEDMSWKDMIMTYKVSPLLLWSLEQPALLWTP